MQAGRIAVKVNSASGFTGSRAAAEQGLGPESQVYIVCELLGGEESFGRLCTEPRAAGAGPDEPTVWEQELGFEVGPTPDRDLVLRAALYAVTPEEGGSADDFIAGGSMRLAHLREVHEQHHVRVPLVSGAGAHLADLSLDLRFFHSRSTARQVDADGRAFIDDELAAAGPLQAARAVNERSPRSPTASPRPGSPRVKPPLHDPQVPELPAGVRTTLGGGEQ